MACTFEGQRGHQESREHRPSHSFSGKRLDIPGRIAQRQNPIAGHVCRASCQKRRTAPRGLDETVGQGKSGLLEDLRRQVSKASGAANRFAIERRRYVETAILQADQARIAIAT